MALPKLSRSERERVAELVGIEPNYLYLLTRGLQKPSPAVARQLHEADSRFELEDLRPDDWQKIWPERV